MELIRNISYFTFLAFFMGILSLSSFVYADNNIIVSPDQIIIPSTEAGTTVYSDNIEIINSEESQTLYISGTDFYDSASSGTRCPETNQLTLTNVAYYAQIGNYTTLNDPRADAEGYIIIPYGVDFEDTTYIPKEIILNHSLISSNSNASIKFRIKVPVPCHGNFDTGSIYLWGKDQYDNISQVGLGLSIGISNVPHVFKCGNTTYL